MHTQNHALYWKIEKKSGLTVLVFAQKNDKVANFE